MNLKILFMLLVYYTLISVFFIGADSENLLDGYSQNIALNTSELGANETDTGGLFNIGVSFTRFFAFVGFGVGLPEDTPSWFNVIFIAWQSLLLVFTIGFILSSIWNG